MVEYLTLDDLLTLTVDLGVPNVRDLGLLDSAAHRPQSSLMGQDAYPTLDEKAAVLLESIARNHPLIDGNKRLAWMATFVCYGLNGVDLDAPEDDAYDLVIGVSTGTVDYRTAAGVLGGWARPEVAAPRGSGEFRLDGTVE
ncbi:type II toxin-antitoxin system death-on-curing family toxin [Alloactinosynnema sp. L-07]|uniref:type II toxin-antitoxin system death-on-curing family toxin n=1 Tax=Alloactinosynnema sp. L-07 TaxID=1653480 RepID=UPI0006B4BC3A|nr:type II toxin-antitoxin system death-on-curing family toxin [Alloactinosynnema sp. L-07]